jgi:hemerythrin
MYFELSRKYFTGIDKIDSQHLKIVDLMNKLHEEIIMNKDDKNVNESILDLKLYAIFHFSTEENMFKKYHYEGENYDEHMAEHEIFNQQIAQFLSDESSSRLDVGYRILEFLKMWLTAHILSIDMKFSGYIKKNYYVELNEDDIFFEDEK